MMEEGLEAEVRSLQEYRSYNALQTVGYRELFEYLDGHCSLEQAVANIRTNTRQYAKRQMTWFKKDSAIPLDRAGGDLKGPYSQPVARLTDRLSFCR
jgi:tRNA dimethylallyltransferase